MNCLRVHVCCRLVAAAAHGWVQLFSGVSRELEASAEDIFPMSLSAESVDVDAVAQEAVRGDSQEITTLGRVVMDGNRRGHDVVHGR